MPTVGVWVLVYGLTLCLGVSAGVSAQSQAAEVMPYWEKIDVAIEVQATGDLLVTETQTYISPPQQTQKRMRRIPLDRLDAITDVRIFEDGHELPVSTRVKANHLRIRWRQPRRAAERHTVVMRYRVKGSVYLHSGGDQILWPALSAEREGPIRQGTVSVRVPQALESRIQQVMSYGAPADVSRVDARTIVFASRAALPPGEKLDVKVVLPHGGLGAAMSDWQQGKEASYTIPGVIGQLDTLAFIVFPVIILGGA
ncbi:MAG: DUF2207 domain-containing protein, partial [Candidatus Tectomicrobia bacterium]|nr:DUF2207 domain-containing protein [Candidatus Tectomicrobia bacterium]